MPYPRPDRRADPLTEEQLALISLWTQHAAKKSLKHYTRNAVLSFLLLLATNVFVWSTAQTLNNDSRQAIVHSGKFVSVAGCNRDFHTIQALRGILTSSRTFQKAALKRGDITQEQFDRSQPYYTKQLAALQLPDCQAAGAVLTSDQDHLAPIPKPLTPEK